MFFALLGSLDKTQWLKGVPQAVTHKEFLLHSSNMAHLFHSYWNLPWRAKDAIPILAL